MAAAGRGPYSQSPPDSGSTLLRVLSDGRQVWYNPKTGQTFYTAPSSGGGLPFNIGGGGNGNLPARPTTPNFGTTVPGLQNPAVSTAVNSGLTRYGTILSGIWGARGLIGDVVGSIIQSKGANAAAETQADAAERAAQILAQAQREALDFQKQQYAQSRSDMKPWLSYGTSAVNTLGNLMGLKPADIPDIPLTNSGSSVPAGQQAQFTRAGTTGGGPLGTSTGQKAVPRSVPAAPTNTLTRTYVPPTSTSTSQTPPVVPQPAPPTTPPGSRTPTGPGGITSQPNPQIAPQDSGADRAGSVTVKWPDGTTTRIPTSQLARYVSLGAQPVGVSGQQAPQQQQMPQTQTMGGMY